jgi:hypothetical protein
VSAPLPAPKDSTSKHFLVKLTPTEGYCSTMQKAACFPLPRYEDLH